jgi:RNA polymerase sigma factor (sigma-70 family)
MNLETLYKKERKTFIYKILSYTRNYAVAEDLVQTAFVKALTSEKQYDKRKSSLKTWFTKILFSCLWTHMREVKKMPITIDIDDVLEYELAYEGEIDVVPYIRAVKNKSHQSVLIGHTVFGYTPGEITHLTGVSGGNVRKILQRFRERKHND